MPKKLLVVLLLSVGACMADAGSEIEGDVPEVERAEGENDGIEVAAHQEELSNGSTKVINSNFGVSMAAATYTSIARSLAMAVSIGHAEMTASTYFQCSSTGSNSVSCVHTTGEPTNLVVWVQNCHTVATPRLDRSAFDCDWGINFSSGGVVHQVLDNNGKWRFAGLWFNNQIIQGNRDGVGGAFVSVAKWP